MRFVGGLRTESVQTAPDRSLKRAKARIPLAEVRQSRLRPLKLNTDADSLQNEGAHRFYRRDAFEPVGTRTFTVDSGSETTPDIIMVRDNGVDYGAR